MEGRKPAKLSPFLVTELFFDDVVDLVLSDKITMLALGFEAKSFAKKDNFNSARLLPKSQEHHGLSDPIQLFDHRKPKLSMLAS